MYTDVCALRALQWAAFAVVIRFVVALIQNSQIQGAKNIRIFLSMNWKPFLLLSSALPLYYPLGSRTVPYRTVPHIQPSSVEDECETHTHPNTHTD